MIAAILCAVCYGVATALQARAAVAGPLIGLLRRWPFVLGLLLDVAGFGAQLVALRSRPLFVVQAAQAGNLAVTAVACVPLLGIRRAPRPRAAVTGPLIGLLRRWPFLLGLLLDVAGFGAQLVALRSRPLFVVQAAQAGNLAVTAVACVPLLGIRLAPRHWAAVLAVSAGLAVLGLSSGPEGTTAVSTSARVVLLVAALVLGAIALVAARLTPIVQGVVAGLGFGLTALAVRSLPSFAPADLVRDPAAYAAVISGICAFVSFAAGLQRQVTTVAALAIVGETALPAAIGITLWGDHTRPGWAVPAVLGFVVALAGALALSRFAEPDVSGSAGAPPSAPPDCPPDTAPTGGPGAPAPETRRPGSA